MSEVLAFKEEMALRLHSLENTQSELAQAESLSIYWDTELKTRKAMAAGLPTLLKSLWDQAKASASQGAYGDIGGWNVLSTEYGFFQYHQIDEWVKNPSKFQAYIDEGSALKFIRNPLLPTHMYKAAEGFLSNTKNLRAWFDGSKMVYITCAQVAQAATKVYPGPNDSSVESLWSFEAKQNRDNIRSMIFVGSQVQNKLKLLGYGTVAGTELDKQIIGVPARMTASMIFNGVNNVKYAKLVQRLDEARAAFFRYDDVLFNGLVSVAYAYGMLQYFKSKAATLKQVVDEEKLAIEKFAKESQVMVEEAIEKERVESEAAQAAFLNEGATSDGVSAQPKSKLPLVGMVAAAAAAIYFMMG